MIFSIRMIQVDNGSKFVKDRQQNGKVEQSHREDGKILYAKKVFTSEKERIEQVAKHETGYNKTAKTTLNFKNPNQVVSEYFSKCNICLDS